MHIAAENGNVGVVIYFYLCLTFLFFFKCLAGMHIAAKNGNAGVVNFFPYILFFIFAWQACI
jgi:hypothetical protein